MMKVAACAAALGSLLSVGSADTVIVEEGLHGLAHGIENLQVNASIGDVIDNVGDSEYQGKKKNVQRGTRGRASLMKLPAKIRPIIEQNWDAMDERGEEMMKLIRTKTRATEFAHGRSPFYTHLQGTFSILSAWDQPLDIRRAGLLHTAYSGDLFSFFLFDDRTGRESLREIVGESSEHLIHQFGTVNRAKICGLRESMNNTASAFPIDGPQTIPHRVVGSVELSPTDAAKILMVTIADYLDQFVITNGWKDHHTVEDQDRLYPGDGRPGIAFYWMSDVCKAIRRELEVIPPAFDRCTKTIDYDTEVEARDLYWRVITEEHSLGMQEKIELLEGSIALNSFVGEPDFMLAQLYYNEEMYEKAAEHAAISLEKLYELASAWDKRLPYEQWVGFARIILYRATRMLNGEETSFPRDDRGLISLQRVFEDMDAQ